MIFKITNNIKGKYDIIISNPPYISLEEYNKLPNHIKKYEPPHALTDYQDGLTFYKRFVHIIKENLNNKGIFICELGLTSTIKSIKKLFLNNGFIVKIIHDLNKDPRILLVTHHD